LWCENVSLVSVNLRSEKEKDQYADNKIEPIASTAFEIAVDKLTILDFFLQKWSVSFFHSSVRW
jgi:hypothetical protein